MSPRSFRRAHARRLAREQGRLANAKRRAAVAGVTLTASALFAASAQAAVNTYTVTSTADDSGSVAPCTGSSPSFTCATLRDAISAANADGQNDAITFQSGLSGTITLGSVLSIEDTGGLMIDGPGAGTLSVSGAGSYQVFRVDSGRGSPVTISGLTVTDGNSGGTPGGAIDEIAGSPLTLSDDVVSGSTTTGGGGGLYSDGTTTISGSTITGNTAGGDGGGIQMRKYSQLAVTGTTISGNTSGRSGGGIESSTKYGTSVSGSTISGNTAASGGGLHVASHSPFYNPVTVDTTTISNNNAPLGAGVDVGSNFGTPVKISASTISGNHGGSDSFGGGLLLEGYVYSPVKMIDSTVSGNSATNGGGVSLGYNGTEAFLPTSGNGSVSFDNSTIAANAADTGGGGIYLSQYNTGSGAQGASANLRSTIVSGNTAAGSAQDLDQAVASSGGLNGAFSLVQHPGNAVFLSQNAMITGADPQLGPLQDNGGPTHTMLPAGTSPVIDQGHAGNALKTDQRGDQRTVDVSGVPNPPGGDGTDIGAVELPASAVVVPPAPKAGFTASIRGQLIGGGSTPPLVHGATKVDCAVKTGTLSTCSVEIRTTGGKLLARGESSTTSPVKSLSTVVSLTGFGRRALYHHPLGLTERANVFGATSASGGQEVTGPVLLLHPFVRLRLGTSAKLPRSVLRVIAKAEPIFVSAGAKSATCTAYSDTGTGKKALTKAQAKAACDALVKDGFTGPVKSVGKGQAHPVAPDNTKKGRSLNRRLVITFFF